MGSRKEVNEADRQAWGFLVGKGQVGQFDLS